MNSFCFIEKLDFFAHQNNIIVSMTDLKDEYPGVQNHH